MKKTRRMFLLSGSTDEVISKVYHELDFKGVNQIYKPSMEQVAEAFSNNKSVVCCEVPSGCKQQKIINILATDNTERASGMYVININDDIIAQFQHIAECVDVDIGDHRSNSSGNDGVPSARECAYCGYVHKDYYDEKVNMSRIVYRSKNFFVMPTLGEFVSGYLIIIPIFHVMSNAELEKSVIEEFLQVLEDVKEILRITYHTSNILVWENGTGNGGKGKAKDSVVHAHTHVAPSKLTARQIEEMSGFSFTRISYKGGLSSYGNHSYLLIQGEDEWFINDNPKLYIPRQYVRQLLAEDYNIFGEEWNWRTHPFLEKIVQTKDDIALALSQNWDKLSERIKENTKDCFK